MKPALCTLLALTGLLCPPPLSAGNDTDLPAWAANGFDRVHDSIGRWVDYSARRLDGLFGSE